MSGSDRGSTDKNRLIQACIIAFLFIGMFSGWGYWFQSGYYQQAADKSAQYQGWADDEIRQRCGNRPDIFREKCERKINQTAHENKRNEYDLYAQRTSALWAGIMAIAALFGIGLSGVGVWLVKTTFDETRKANEIANKGVRPWIVVEGFKVKRLFVFVNPENDAKGAVVEAEIVVRNVGKAPAYNFRHRGGPVTNIDEAERVSYPIDLFGDCIAPNQKTTVSVVGKIEICKWSEEPNETGLFKPIIIMVSLIYASQKDSNPHETRQFWRIGSRVNDSIQMWSDTDMVEGKIEAELAMTSRMT